MKKRKFGRDKPKRNHSALMQKMLQLVQLLDFSDFPRQFNSASQDNATAAAADDDLCNIPSTLISSFVHISPFPHGKW